MAQCQMIVGVLIPHRCPRKARSRCIQCQRVFCDEHVELTEAGLVCTACRKGLSRPVSEAEMENDFTDADIDVFYEDDDPFVDLS